MNPLNSILKWILGFYGLLDYLGVWAGLGVELKLVIDSCIIVHMYNPRIHEST